MSRNAMQRIAAHFRARLGRADEELTSPDDGVFDPEDPVWDVSMGSPGPVAPPISFPATTTSMPVAAPVSVDAAAPAVVGPAVSMPMPPMPQSVIKTAKKTAQLGHYKIGMWQKGTLPTPEGDVVVWMPYYCSHGEQFKKDLNHVEKKFKESMNHAFCWYRLLALTISDMWLIDGLGQLVRTPFYHARFFIYSQEVQNTNAKLHDIPHGHNDTMAKRSIT